MDVETVTTSDRSLLRAVRGELSNRTLLDDLRVHRSSAVCAILARVPGVVVSPGRAITLSWKGRP